MELAECFGRESERVGFELGCRNWDVEVLQNYQALKILILTLLRFRVPSCSNCETHLVLVPVRDLPLGWVLQRRADGAVRARTKAVSEELEVVEELAVEEPPACTTVVGEPDAGLEGPGRTTAVGERVWARELLAHTTAAVGEQGGLLGPPGRTRVDGELEVPVGWGEPLVGDPELEERVEACMRAVGALPVWVRVPRVQARMKAVAALQAVGRKRADVEQLGAGRELPVGGALEQAHRERTPAAGETWERVQRARGCTRAVGVPGELERDRRVRVLLARGRTRAGGALEEPGLPAVAVESRVRALCTTQRSDCSILRFRSNRSCTTNHRRSISG